MMEERDAMQVMKLEALRHDINQGLTSIEQGQSKPLNIDALKTKGRAQLPGSAD